MSVIGCWQLRKPFGPSEALSDLCDRPRNGCWHQNLAHTSPCGSGKSCKADGCL